MGQGKSMQKDESGLLQQYSIKDSLPERGEWTLLHRRSSTPYLLKKFEYDSEEHEQLVMRLQNKTASNNENLLGPIEYKIFNEGSKLSPRLTTFVLFEFTFLSLAEEINSRNEQNRLFEEEELISIFCCCALALKHLNSQEESHGSVCPQNVFLNESGIVQLVDPLAGRVLPSQPEEGLFLSPEVLSCIQDNEQRDVDGMKSDIFALGMCLVQCSLLEPSLECYDYNAMEIDYHLLDQKLTRIEATYSKDFVKMLRTMLHENWEERADIDDLEYLQTLVNEKQHEECGEAASLQGEKKPDLPHRLPVFTLCREETPDLNTVGVNPTEQQNFDEECQQEYSQQQDYQQQKYQQSQGQQEQESEDDQQPEQVRQSCDEVRFHGHLDQPECYQKAIGQSYQSNVSSQKGGVRESITKSGVSQSNPMVSVSPIQKERQLTTKKLQEIDQFLARQQQKSTVTHSQVSPLPKPPGQYAVTPTTPTRGFLQPQMPSRSSVKHREDKDRGVMQEINKKIMEIESLIGDDRKSKASIESSTVRENARSNGHTLSSHISIPVSYSQSTIIQPHRGPSPIQSSIQQHSQPRLQPYSDCQPNPDCQPQPSHFHQPYIHQPPQPYIHQQPPAPTAAPTMHHYYQPPQQSHYRPTPSQSNIGCTGVSPLKQKNYTSYYSSTSAFVSNEPVLNSINMQPTFQSPFTPMPAWSQPLYVPYQQPLYPQTSSRPLSPIRTNLPIITPLRATPSTQISEFNQPSMAKMSPTVPVASYIHQFRRDATGRPQRQESRIDHRPEFRPQARSQPRSEHRFQRPQSRHQLGQDARFQRPQSRHQLGQEARFQRPQSRHQLGQEARFQHRPQSRHGEGTWRVVGVLPPRKDDEQLFTDPKLLEMVRNDLQRKGNKENKAWQAR